MGGCGGGGREVKLYRRAVNHLKPHLYPVKYCTWSLPQSGWISSWDRYSHLT